MSAGTERLCQLQLVQSLIAVQWNEMLAIKARWLQHYHGGDGTRLNPFFGLLAPFYKMGGWIDAVAELTATSLAQGNVRLRGIDATWLS